MTMLVFIGVLVEDFHPAPRFNSRLGRSVFDGISSSFADNGKMD